MTFGSAICSIGLTGIGVLMVLHPTRESWPGWVCFAVALVVALSGARVSV